MMTDMLAHERPESAAAALQVLRRSFPDYPLALRLLAIANTMNRQDRELGTVPADECPSLAGTGDEAAHSPR